MTITISPIYFYYWIFSVVFESIYIYIQWVRFKRKGELYDRIMEIKSAMLQSASFKFMYKKIFNPFVITAFLIFFSIVSMFMLPLSLWELFKKLIGYKSKLEKQADEEAAAYARAKDFMKDEGDIGVESEIVINCEK